MELSVNQIAQIIKGEVVGDGEKKIHNISKIQEGTEGTLSFLANPKYEEHIYSTNASAVLVNKDFKPKKEIASTLIYVEDAYVAFTELLTEYQKLILSLKVGIESPSFIDDSAQVGDQIYVGAFAYIGKNVKIGNNVKIYPNTFIGDNVTIGDNCTLYAGVKVYNDTIIGNHCTLQAGAVIGSDGFGFAPQKDGTYKTIPQIGNVILEDNVDIGANTVVDCATMGSTVVKQGAKLDNLIQVAHNVVIGKNTVIASQTGVSGSSTIGDNCMIGGQVGVAGHLSVANGTQIGAQSGLAKSVKEENTKIMGTPAISFAQNLKAFAVTRNLPELAKTVKQLEKEIANLKKD
ncbi:UDP-3-O-(3-hydroxymyristoyl)glucosamine N-acyltransferase [Sediminitomix flava]|uniref:UDP-3-O-acylglucosamine N-acyltransferase n=1 Tax=Sediminitomix flava TaxID=379075 RepID=A0A315ZGS4_SEDFL|nr:UDP-3-O-(3-hydroxymyristoyl)glucosamine N-acyltransferase [Sediminitomix flava]PWJ44805.1 UDP-3-O-[3-hydroxymyristoyl] glucosamine N-acyltransferase [Sediminitomix flava]